MTIYSNHLEHTRQHICNCGTKLLARNSWSLKLAIIRHEPHCPNGEHNHGE